VRNQARLPGRLIAGFITVRFTVRSGLAVLAERYLAKPVLRPSMLA